MSRVHRGNNDRRSNGRAMVIVGLVMILLAVMGYKQEVKEKKELERCTETTQGVITNVDEQLRTRKKQGHDERYYVIVVDYVYEADGRKIEASFTLPQGAGRPDGSTVDIHYDPNEPEVHYSRFDESSQKGSMVLVIAFGALGVIFIALGTSSRFKYVKDDYV